MVSELTNYSERIEDLHRQVSGVIAALPAQALNWRPLEAREEHATNSLAVLAAHIAGAEHYWMGEVVGRGERTRVREAEFTTVAKGPAELIGLLEKAAQQTRQVFSTLSDTNMNDPRQADGRTMPVRWCILHVIDHTALHLGHMQITYQLWSGGKSIYSPLWIERLPKD
jgi:uncharacterized damage-inducible protein DinB